MERSVQLDENARLCVRRCEDGHRICLEVLAYALRMGNSYATPGIIGVLMDCAEICRITADFTLRGSERSGVLYSLCIDMCEQCAKRCDEFGEDDRMTACSDICRACADSCRRVKPASERTP